MKTLTIKQAFSQVRREVTVEGFDPHRRVVRIRFGAAAGMFSFDYENGQGVEPEVEYWVLADLQGVREHVYKLGFEPGPLLEPCFRDRPKPPKPPTPKPPDPRQGDLFGEPRLDRLAAINKRMTQGTHAPRRSRFGGVR